MPRQPISQRSFKLLLMISDLLALVTFFLLAHQLRFKYLPNNYLLDWHFGVVVLAVVISSYVFDLYDPHSQIAGLRAPARIWFGTLVAAGAIALYLYLAGKQANRLYGRGVMPTALTAFALWGSLVRFWVARWLRKRGRYIRWLALGNYDYLTTFWNDFKASGTEGHIALLVSDEDQYRSNKGDIPIAGTYKDLDQWLLKGWSGIVVCTDDKLPDPVVEKLLYSKILGLRVYNLTDFYEDVWFKVPVYYLDRSWLALTQGFGLLHNRVGLRLKQICDFVGALILIPVALPITLLGMFLILIESGFPVIYRQTRTGKDGKPFTIYKLRTMKKDAESQGAQWAAKDDNRALFFGHYLRKTRIDELPQLYNVLCGDMSFIGPRPERPEFNANLEKQIPHYALRHIVRPGITGWAQVLYHYGASVSDAREKLQYDLYYIKNYSFVMDIAIVLKTVRLMLLGSGR